MTYQVTNGGHAPGDLRDSFLEAVEAFGRAPVGEEQAILAELNRLSGQLWNCSDQLPAEMAGEIWDMFDRFGDVPGTYAQAARAIRRRTRAEAAA